MPELSMNVAQQGIPADVTKFAYANLAPRLSLAVRHKPMRPLHIPLILSLLLGVGGTLTACRKSVWTKQEVTDWYAKNSSVVRGGLGYQGSDAQSHHFIARVMDEWVFIEVPKS